ncbi:hypothetical protein PAXRUDRAFT_571325 [Paxillus rubicundulus Ve08.2h10]|uniref:Uncharacterized protein n=1 Tax=Paxillus rubicundulus Ve08.2h10 TaxID=930991 RepID=A0A0D0DLZ9_9AGAM|nr:hypothetical protein PAXRUDRAFT_571325 [Paxillus rubicundulus Ve08.2h10]
MEIETIVSLSSLSPSPPDNMSNASTIAVGRTPTPILTRDSIDCELDDSDIVLVDPQPPKEQSECKKKGKK